MAIRRRPTGTTEAAETWSTGWQLCVRSRAREAFTFTCSTGAPGGQCGPEAHFPEHSLIPLLPQCLEALDAAKGDPAWSGVSVSFVYDAFSRHAIVANPANPPHETRVALFCAILIATLETSRRSLQTRVSWHGRRGPGERGVAGLDLAPALAELRARIDRLRKAGPFQGFTGCAVLGPDLAGAFVHEVVGHSREGDQASLPQPFAPGRPGLFIIDDPSLPDRLGSYTVDDEGNQGIQVALVDDGRPGEFLHSAASAARSGDRMNGRGRTVSYRHPPIPRMSNTFVRQGSTPLADLVASVPFGVLAEGALGGKASGGRYLLKAAHGRYIRNGKLAEDIGNIAISGTTSQALPTIVGIGDHLEWCDALCDKSNQRGLPVSYGSPALVVSGVTINPA